MSALLLLITVLAVSLAVGFMRLPLKHWTAAVGVTLALFTLFGEASGWTLLAAWVTFAAVAAPLNHASWRRRFITRPALAAYRRMAPQISATEATALAAGTVGWEGELFAGKPDFRRLLKQPRPMLSTEERDFLDGPVEEACRMIDDWDMTHRLADLSPELWQYLKDQRFFGMIIPKRYGGLEFSALAHSAVIQKLASKSWMVSSTVSVPNSLGPAELLMHYGTEEQKNYYLPRLAQGREIPCFGLTGPTAGSDATSIPDTGVVCHGQFNGEEVLGIRLTFDKRYITLAPVATVVGLAFQLKDPDGLLGDQPDIGISLALLPRDTPGMEIGKRHFPLNVPFQNGPIRGTNVFVPLDYLIGGREMAGQGWRMLVECLSVGRAISLPSSAAGGARAAALATGAYARVRKQFNLPIGRFEGVEEALARIGGYAYATTALAEATAAAVDRGEKPAITSAIAKYHATEMSRKIAADSMDVHGGKGIILGPRNYAGRGWQVSPVSITVEGANIMTRSLMIFGQGALRCHPWVLKEMEALQFEDRRQRENSFDRALFGHIGLSLSNACRALLLGLSGGRLARASGARECRRYYRALARHSAALGLAADVAMLTLGGKLKFKEKLSARLGDVLSQLYILSAILKRHHDQGSPSADLPLLHWSARDAVFKIEDAFATFLRNFPSRPLGWLLRVIIFPLGRRALPPSDHLGHQVASLLLAPNEARERLTESVYKTAEPGNPVGLMEAALADIILAEPLERRLQKALRRGEIDPGTDDEQLTAALRAGVISEADQELLTRTRAAVAEIIAVDEFEHHELTAGAASRGDSRTSQAAA